MTRPESRKEQLARLRNGLNSLYQPTGKSPGSGFSRLPGTPKLLLGESFSSWQWRIQRLLRIPTKALQSALGLHGPAEWVDAGRPRLDVEHLARTVMHPVESLLPLSWPGQSLLSDLRLACLTSSPVRKRPIIRYCELCLRSDPVPYIRQLWRLACAYVCPEHGTILRELCPHCQQALRMPAYKHRHRDQHLRQCHACGNDLCAAPPAILPSELGYFVLARQTELLQLISAESRLVEIWDGLRTSTEYSFSNGASSLIETESEQLAWMLFARLLGDYVARTKPSAEQARSTLETYLIRTPIDAPRDETGAMAVAFNGLKVFQEHAVSVFMHLVGRHDPWGATHWGSEELVREMLGSQIFNIGDFMPELQRSWPGWQTIKKFRRTKRELDETTSTRKIAMRRDDFGPRTK